MPFPEVPRVIYQKNPLAQVICQVRFPPVLQIEQDIPADFQDRVRREYPLFEEKVRSYGLPPEVLHQLPPHIEAQYQRARSYDFLSEDENWVVGLTRDFLSLTCRNYERWEEFSNRLGKLIDALVQIYEPNHFSRIGLRYQNVIRRSDIGVGRTEWRELLKPHIVAELGSSDLDEDSYLEAGHRLLISLGNDFGKVRIQHGLIQDTLDVDENRCYLIDNDFFTDQRTSLEEVSNVLTRFNQQSRRLFRWCISDRLHDAMGPRIV